MKALRNAKKASSLRSSGAHPKRPDFMGTPDPNNTDAHSKLPSDTGAEVGGAARTTHMLCDNGILP